METTDRYRQMLRRANQVAARSGRAVVEPEDLAIALSESTGVGAAAIKKQGCKLRWLRQRIIDRFHVPREGTAREGFIAKAIDLFRSFATGHRPTSEQVLELSEVTANALAVAPGEAESLWHNYVGTEHVLLGLLREGGPVAQLFQAEGLTYSASREAIQTLLGHTVPC